MPPALHQNLRLIQRVEYLPVHGELLILIVRKAKPPFPAQKSAQRLRETSGANSLLIPCYSLFRFWANFLKDIELWGVPPKIERIWAQN